MSSEIYFPRFVRERHAQLDLFEDTYPEDGACLLAYEEALALSKRYLVHGDAAFLYGGDARERHAHEERLIMSFAVGAGTFLAGVNLYLHRTGSATPATLEDIEQFMTDYPHRRLELNYMQQASDDIEAKHDENKV
jgi:hypothetical protein